MNRRKLILTSLLLGTICLNGLAGPRSRQQALNIAKEKANTLGISVTTPVLARRSAAKLTAKSNAPFYVFNNGSNKGWTIVSGDDRMPEVLGYADSGSLDMDNLPEALQDIFNSIEATYTKLDSQPATTNKSIRKTAATGTVNAPVGPLCVTKWDQYKPYNNLTPVASTGEQTAVCCVATGMAQIIYYLYSTHGGQASSTFTNSISSGGGPFGGTSTTIEGPRTYNWDKMLTDYESAEYTEEQANEIATFMRHCGAALNVNYNYPISTAYTSSVPNVATRYFGLSSSAKDRSYQTVEELFAAIDVELNNLYPVQVAGNAHSFVCDGRDASGQYYHFNFGYSGHGDGFYCSDAYNGYGKDMEVVTGLRLSDEAVTPATAKEKLDIIHKAATATASLEPVGTTPGFYQQEYYDALKTLTDKAADVLAGTITMSDAEIQTLINNIGAAEQKMTECRTPYPNGYYYIKTAIQYYPGIEYAMYSSTFNNNVTAAWAKKALSPSFKWELEYDAATNGYYIKSVEKNQYISAIECYKDVTFTKEKQVPCEVVTTNRVAGTNDYQITIRPMCDGYRSDQYHYLVQNRDNEGDANGFVYGFDAYNFYGLYKGTWVLEKFKDAPTAYFAKTVVSMKQRETIINEFITSSTGIVTYSSSDESVATVDAEGKVTATGVGKAVITATVAETDENAAAEVSYNVTVTENEELNAQLKDLIASAQSLYTKAELTAAQESESTEIEKSLTNLGAAVATASAVTNAFQEDLEALSAAIDRYKNSVPTGTSIKIDGILPRYVVKQLNANTDITSIDLTGATMIFNNLRLRDNCEITTSAEGVPATTLSYTCEGENEWGTICVPFELASDDDIQYYVMGGTQTSGSNIIYFDPVESVAPNQPAVYQKAEDEITVSSEEDELILNTNAAGTLAAIDNLRFTGSYKNITITSGFYLSDNQFVNANNNTFTVKPYHAYFSLDKDGKPDAESFIIAVKTPTGIKDITNQLNGTSHTIHSVMGTRLTTPVKGINIIDGKKVLIK